MADENEVKPVAGTDDVKEVKEVKEVQPEAGTDETTQIVPALSNTVEPKKIGSISDKNPEDVDPKAIYDSEAVETKLPYPKSVFFIISNEFCERFNYYGMRTILVLYLSHQLNYSDDTATVIFHIFTMFVYFLCVLGAIISDSWLGKFKTILYLSIVYVCGSILVALGAMPPLNLPATTFTMIGLSLIALGSGGIKPCVSAFGGDQFKMPEQLKQMTTFFSLFYFSINAGSLISTTVTPILREDVHCFGDKDCYSLAFGVPAVLMAVSIVIFVLGRPLYKSKPPAGNMVVLVSKTIGNAISTKWKEKKTNPREHWLDYADKKYDRQLIEDVKVLMRVLVLYLPLPVFWALFDQQGSRWTFQATRMDGDMGSWDIKPDQLQVLNPLLILVFIPLYDIAFYPALSLIGIRRPLQKLTAGGILAGIAFIISALVELELEKTYPVPPSPGHFELRIFSGVPDCKYVLTTNLTEYPEVHLNSIDYWLGKEIRTENGKLTVAYSFVDENREGCPKFPGGRFTFQERKSYSIFLQDKIKDPLVSIYDEEVEKSSKANPLVRNLANVDKNRNIAWKPSNSDEAESTQKANYRKLIELRAHTYDIMVDNVKVYDVKLRHGGVYSLVIGSNTDGTFTAKIFEVTEPNSMNILWLVPQYVVMTLGEVMFSVTGLEFSYSQAPVTMKSVLQACWLLTVAFGNIIVVIIAEAKFFKSQASEFFLFAGLMFADMFIFMYVAYRYKPNNPNDVLKKQDECNDTNNDGLEQQIREHFIRNQRQQQATTLPAIQLQQQQHPWTTDQNQSGKSSRYTKRQID